MMQASTVTKEQKWSLLFLLELAWLDETWTEPQPGPGQNTLPGCVCLLFLSGAAG
jgi:hypothetical protein